MLHCDETWGAGTTEYALDAILSAVEGRAFACPVPLTARLPMIFAEDLVDGLLRLQAAKRECLLEPQAGCCIAGFSFAAEELLALLRARYPHAVFTVAEAQPASHFAKLWPDSICPRQAQDDLGFQAKFGFRETVETIAKAHEARLQWAKSAAQGAYP